MYRSPAFSAAACGSQTIVSKRPVTLINQEVSGGPLLAPEYLALQHRLSIR